ncbi:MAG: crossover junction endodeoxyribonuclease RuvC [Planctomycetes bacterium]|nr:crossover junction endodeoxyribonuclease RuvC [Planctomycetota bacterium]
MRIVGIDPGLHLTGYGCVDLDGPGTPRLVEAGVIKLRRNRPMAERLDELYTDLCVVLDQLEPDRMVVEQLFSHYRHVRTSILMGHARGVVLLAGQQRGIELNELAPAEIKKAVTGNGQATKAQMQQAVMVQCDLPELPEPPDVADAIGIALCAARRLELEGLTPRKTPQPDATAAG